MGIVEGFFSSLSAFVVGPITFPLEVGSEDDTLLFKLLDLFTLSAFITLIALIGWLIPTFISINTHSLGMGIVEDFSSSLSSSVVVPGAFPLGVGSEDDCIHAVGASFAESRTTFCILSPSLSCCSFCVPGLGFDPFKFTLSSLLSCSFGGLSSLSISSFLFFGLRTVFFCVGWWSGIFRGPLFAWDVSVVSLVSHGAVLSSFPRGTIGWFLFSGVDSVVRISPSVPVFSLFESSAFFVWVCTVFPLFNVVLIAFTIVFAILSLPFKFKCRPCFVKMSRSVSTFIIHALSNDFKSCFSFLLYSFTSWLTHEFASRSCLWGTLITMILVPLWLSTKFLIWCSPFAVSFLPTSRVSPYTTKTSFFVSFAMVLVGAFTIVCRFAPGFTKPWTTKPCPRLCCNSWAHPLAWLSPIIIIFLRFSSVVVLLSGALPFLFWVALLLLCSRGWCFWSWFWRLFGNTYLLIIVGIGWGSGCFTVVILMVLVLFTGTCFQLFEFPHVVQLFEVMESVTLESSSSYNILIISWADFSSAVITCIWSFRVKQLAHKFISSALEFWPI